MNFNMLPGTCRNCNQTKLREEAKIYDDIVVFDFLDTYPNLTIKTIVSLNWIFNVYNTDLYLKVDDDVLFNVTDVYLTVLKHLDNNTESIGNYILGNCVNNYQVKRNLKHKLGVSREEYSSSKYPRFCIGQSYAITRSVIPLLLNQTHNTPLIHMKDISLGILAQKVGDIKLVDIPKWRKGWNGSMNLTQYRTYHILHTNRSSANKLQELWKKINT